MVNLYFVVLVIVNDLWKKVGIFEEKNCILNDYRFDRKKFLRKFIFLFYKVYKCKEN